MAANGISRARRYGISVESAIAAFVDLMFSVAPNSTNRSTYTRFSPTLHILRTLASSCWAR